MKKINFKLKIIQLENYLMNLQQELQYYVESSLDKSFDNNNNNEQ